MQSRKYTPQRKLPFIFALPAVAFALLLFTENATASIAQNLQEIGLEASFLNKFDSFKVISETERSSSYRLDGKQKIFKIRSRKNISKQKAKKIIENKKFVIFEIYTNQRSPYPGFLTNKMVCSENYRPIAFDYASNIQSLYGLLLWTNERFVPGSCVRKLNTYRSVFAWLYCPKRKELYDLKYFTPINSSDKTLKSEISSIQCR